MSGSEYKISHIKYDKITIKLHLFERYKNVKIKQNASFNLKVKSLEVSIQDCTFAGNIYTNQMGL